MGSRQTNYEIKLRGRLDKRWRLWFEDLAMTTEVDEESRPITVLSGHIADQAALHGILAKIRDIGISLISVHQVGMAKENGISSDNVGPPQQDGAEPSSGVGVHNAEDKRRP